MPAIAYESLDDIINDCLPFEHCIALLIHFRYLRRPKFLDLMDRSFVLESMHCYIAVMLCAYAFSSLITLQHRLFTLNGRWFSAFHFSKMSHSKLNMICYSSSVINLCDWIIKWVLFSETKYNRSRPRRGKAKQNNYFQQTHQAPTYYDRYLFIFGIFLSIINVKCSNQLKLIWKMEKICYHLNCVHTFPRQRRTQ